MVNAKEAAEGKYLKPAIVKASKTRVAVVVDAGEYKKTQYGKQLAIGISLDKALKEWSINQQTAMNLVKAYGESTEDWLGKRVKLELVPNKNGQDSIVGFAMDGDKVIENIIGEEDVI